MPCFSLPTRRSVISPFVCSYLAVFLFCKSNAFLQPSLQGHQGLQHRNEFPTRRKVSEIIGSPADLSDAFHSGLQGLQHLHDMTSAASLHAPVDSAESVTKSVEAIVSSLYVDAKDSFYLGPAKEHTNPLFGPPDPYLAAGKSINPTSLQSLLESGNLKASSDLVSSSAQPETLASPKVQAEIAKGYKILDASRLVHKSDVLPGFHPTGGILPHHNPQMRESPEIFAKQVEWAAGFLNVLDKLPFVAFAYALMEFFFLRPGVDFFKEDIEEEPLAALRKTVMVTGVRMGVFFFLALVTLVFVGT